MKNTNKEKEAGFLKSVAFFGLSGLFGGVFVSAALCLVFYRGSEWLSRA
jgi:hypothetical protein